MPSPDVLEAAGQRAAFRPVPLPQPVDALTQEVGRRQKKRRIIGGAVAALALVVAVPVGASLIGDAQPDVVTFASEDGDGDETSGAAVAVQPSDTTPTTSTTTVADADDTSPFAGMSDENFDLSLNFGDVSISIEVITGGDAAERAAAAENSADNTRTVDGETVWLDEQGDQITAAAFYDGETFVQVTGPAEQIDKILDLVTEHANGPMHFFDHDQFVERFDLPEGLFDEDFTLGDDFPFGKDGPFGEDFPFDAESFFDEGALEDFRTQMDEFSTCMNVTVDRSGSTTKIEIPDCDLPDIDGLVGPGVLDGFFDDDRFGDLFDDDAIDDLLGEFEDDLKDALEDADDS